ncbi:hypothetical protein JCM17961_00070 [Endothiovibrio diazotrophicus]
MDGIQENVLNGIDSQYRQMVARFPRYFPVLEQYNRFRIRNAGRLSFERPRFLIGAMNFETFPNFHTFGLLRVADVVSLSGMRDDPRVDRVYWNPFSDRFEEIMARLPEGFEPHLFWDNQVDGEHHIPLGLERAPIPTVAGLCHMFRRGVIRHVCEVFDVVLPLSTRFTPLVAAFDSAHIVDLPFGLNWGSLGDVIQPKEEKSIDVSITFGAGVGSYYGNFRARVYQRAKAFAEHYGERYRIVFASGLEKGEYLELLRDSRISLNVVGFHGPYNYRTCEVMNAGALLFQLSTADYPFDVSLDDYFVDGEHYVSFDLENFEERLLGLLEAPQEVARIACAGQQFLEERYGYDRLYEEMIRAVASIDFDFTTRPSEEASLFHVGQLYWHYENPAISRLVVLSLPSILESAPSVRDNNLLAVLPRLFEWYQAAELEGLLRPYPALAGRVSRGIGALVDYLGERVPQTLLGRWNRFAAQLHGGGVDEARVREMLTSAEAADDGEDLDDPALIFNSQLQPAYLSPREYHDARTALLEIPLLRHGADAAAVGGVYRDFIRWHCYRYLAAEVAPFEFGAQALALFPDNASLHRELAGRYRAAGDEATAVGHDRRVAEIEPALG